MDALLGNVRSGDWLTAGRIRLWAAAMLAASGAGLLFLIVTKDGKMQTMMVRSTLLITVLMLLLGVSEGLAVGRQTCGVKLGDWCRSYRGDPCNRHKSTATCKADRKCYGMPYKGESFVACIFDERGFASNCPTVGCTRKAPKR